MKVFLNEQEKRAAGQKDYFPEGKKKKEKVNPAKVRRDRMVSYGRKIQGFTPLTFGLPKPDVSKVDYDDIKNRKDKDTSDFGKLIAFK